MYLKAEYDEIVLKAVRRASEIEPNNGAWHFLTAVELNQLGEWDESILEFQKSLDGTTFRLPQLFPEREYLSTLYDLRKNPEIALFGLGYFETSSFTTSTNMRIKDSFKNALVATAMNGDISTLNLLNRCAVKLSTSSMERSTLGSRQILPVTYSLSGTILVQTLIEFYLDEYGNDLSKADRMALDAVMDRIDQSNDKYRFSTGFTSGFVHATSLITLGNPYNPDSLDIDALEHPSLMENARSYFAIVDGYFKRDNNAINACDLDYLNAVNFAGQNRIDIEPLAEFDFNCPAESMKRVYEKTKEIRQEVLTNTSGDTKEKETEADKSGEE